MRRDERWMRGLLLVTVFLAAGPATEAHATGFAAPTPNLLFQLQKQNRSHPWLRVATDTSRLTLHVLRIDEQGLDGLSGRKSDPDPPARLAWRAISRIDEVVTREQRGRVAGFVLLGLAGAGLGNAIGAPDHKGGSDALLGLAAFGALGAWQGGRLGRRFVHERSWYVASPAAESLPDASAAFAETTIASRPPESTETQADATLSRLSTSPDVLRACSRIGRDDLIRVRGDFGEFQGFASVVGPQGMDGLRTRRANAAGSVPTGLVPWDRIRRVDKRGRSFRNGALVGGALFGILGGMVAAAAVTVANGSETPGTAFVEGALASGAVGAGLGGLIGGAFPGWHRIYGR